jgi:hypothetical protein
MKTRISKQDLGAIILNELLKQYPDSPAVSVGVSNALPDKWVASVVSHGSLVPGNELATANRIADALREKYELTD